MLKEELYHELIVLYNSLRDSMRQKWNRDLPFDELLFDRWDRARDLNFAEGANIYHMSYVYGDVRVGKDTWVGPFTILDGTGGLTIGNSCCISSGVHIYTHDTVKRFVSGGKAPNNYKSTTINDCCFIGPLSVIRSGVTIGEHCVIGAKSFVNCDIPACSIAAGIPARIIGKVHLTDNGDVSFEYIKKQ